jgi:catechol 2,3-dioxygenase-like lactoylglutathione lyase family enzyme
MAGMASTRDILIQTESVEEAIAFYGGVLGLAALADSPMPGFEAGAFRLYIDGGPALAPVLEFLVDDLPAAKARLLTYGCTVEKEDPAVPCCYLRDPFGLVFNLGRRRA